MPGIIRTSTLETVHDDHDDDDSIHERRNERRFETKDSVMSSAKKQNVDSDSGTDIIDLRVSQIKYGRTGEFALSFSDEFGI